MYDSSLTNFLTGAAIMASGMIKSPSYVMIDVYKKDGERTNNLIPSTYTFDEIIKIFFYERDDIIEIISYLIKSKVGEPTNIYELKEKEFKKQERESRYYILEDAYVMETEKYLVYLMIGNNE